MSNATFYSQHGEDFLLNEIFNRKRDGFFVEIGCIDGIEYSNSYFFEKSGWKGLCIEAHNGFIKDLTKNRPNSRIIHCAVGEENLDKVTFYANKIGSLSTLLRTEAQPAAPNSTESVWGHEEQTVPMRTLNNIFATAGVDKIDFVSMDIEGYEEYAIRGWDLNKYRPRVLLIEFMDKNHQQSIQKMVEPFGYHLAGTIGCNAFYSINQSDDAVFDRSYGTVPLVHVDENGQQTMHDAFLLKPNLWRKIKYRLRKLVSGK